jgi:hypothetical protein
MWATGRSVTGRNNPWMSRISSETRQQAYRQLRHDLLRCPGAPILLNPGKRYACKLSINKTLHKLFVKSSFR